MIRRFKIGKHIVTWKKGYIPRCTCWWSRFMPTLCPHIRILADKIEHGEID